MWQRLVVIGALLLLGWQVVANGMAHMASERLAAIYAASWVSPWLDGIDSIAPDSRLRLTAGAWSSLADQALVRGDKAKAEAYAWRGVNHNITSGRPVARLLVIRDLEGKLEEANHLAEISIRLWPMHEDTLLRVAYHWITREDVNQLLQTLNILLTQTSTYNANFFPPLHELATSAEGIPLLRQYATSAPSWWPGFFNHLTQHEKNLTIVKEYYQARQQSTVPLSKGEQHTYINRLLQEKDWLTARQTWLNSLDDTVWSRNALLFDGGFESNITNEGFAWYFTSNKQTKIETGSTYGINGKQALRVTFKDDNKPLDFQHVWQRLLLQSGDYQLTLRYRIDHFDSKKGLRWRLRCEDNLAVLAESAPLLGSYDNGWKTLTVNVNVPNVDLPHDTIETGATCDSQLLRLEATSRFAHEQLFKGTLWFDDIAIESRAKEPS